MSYLYLDIETIPCQDKERCNELVANAKPPANYKKEEAIAKWRQENAKDIIAKTSFDGSLGHICQISVLIGDSYASLTLRKDLSTEAAMLCDFVEYVDAALKSYRGAEFTISPTIVGHNVNAFDIPFLWKRAICLGVRLPLWFPQNPKPWGSETFDTMTAWDSRNFISMDNLCKALGIEGKGNVDGSMVAQMWSDGKHQEIADYCMDDVLKTKQIHEKFMKAGM